MMNVCTGDRMMKSRMPIRRHLHHVPYLLSHILEPINKRVGSILHLKINITITKTYL